MNNNTKIMAGKSTKGSNPSQGSSKIEGSGRGKSSINKNVQITTKMNTNKPVVNPPKEEKEEEDDATKKRKKKKPTASKLERQRKREEEKFKQLYGPKDSHIQIISQAVLQKLQGNLQPPKRNTPTINKTTSNQILPTPNRQQQVIQQRTLFSPEESFPPLSSSSLSTPTTWRNTLQLTVQDFPALNSQDSTNTTTTEQNSNFRIEQESEWETDTENVDEENKDNGNHKTVISRTTDQIKSQISNSSSNNNNKSGSSTISYLSIVTTPRPKPTTIASSSSSTNTTPTTKKVVVETKSTIVSSQNEPGTSKKKLSKKPMVISLDDLIIKKSTTTKDSRVKTKRKLDVTKHFKTNLTIGNTLDSSGPRFIHRGKIREKPKKKKPTKLKLAIMKTRMDRLQKRLIIKTSPSTSNLIQNNLKPDFVGLEIVHNSVGSKDDVLKELENFKYSDDVKIKEEFENEIELKPFIIKNEDNNDINTIIKKSISGSDDTEKNDQNENDPTLLATKSKKKKKKRKKPKSQTLSSSSNSTSITTPLNISSKFIPMPEEGITLIPKEEIKQEEGIILIPKEEIRNSSLSSPIHIPKTVDKNVENTKIIDDVNIFGNLLNTALKESKEINNKIIESSPIDPIELSVADKIKCFSPEVISKAKESLHSRKLKPYCDMYTSKELHGCVIALMKELHRFQDRLYHSDPIKFKTKRRYIHGIKDSINNLKLNKVVLIIFAPDIESNNAEGGLDEKIEEIKSLAKDKNVPVIYSGNRFILGKPIFVKTSVSVIAVLDRQGAEELFHKVLEQAKQLREKYENDVYEKLQKIVQE